ncbi:MAG: hypothetical protein AAB225_01345 [Acidobacteriota bacterium]
MTPTITTYWMTVLLACSAAAAVEKAAYDSTGRIIALLSEAEDLEVTSSLVAVLPGGKRVPLQVRTPRRPLRREPGRLAWSGSFELPDESQGRFQLEAAEDAAGLGYTVAVTAETRLELEAVEFVLDLPRPVFVNGRMSSEGGAEVVLPAVKPADPVFYRGEIASLRLAGADGAWVLAVSFEGPHAVALVDRWEPRGRSYQLRAVLQRGPLAAGAAAALKARFRLTGKAGPGAACRLALNNSKPRYRFDGFGGNYCWSNQSPIAAYTLNNLKIAWARTEMKLFQWDKERDNPGAAIRADLEVMRRFHQMGAPYVISIWWLPERLYTDPHEKPRRAHFRRIDPEKWDQVLELVGSYLLYAKREYSVEPDLFSFNEANIGVYVGFDPEDHARAIKRFGAHFRKLGLKTKMLLGDATGPRDTHNYVLAAAADPEAMEFVGAVAFHSWGGASAEQYAAWGDVGEWLRLPLLVTELGVDAASYHTRAWDSFHYGLREARMTQEILLHARPQGAQFWQFTNDYGLARLGTDGKVEPTSRFWLMKHFTDLTPPKSEALATSSDQPRVLFTAFRAGGQHTLHILNLGGAREAVIDGLPDAEWRAVETTETEHYQARQAGTSGEGKLRLNLAPRSLITLRAQAGSADQAASSPPGAVVH